MQLEIIIKKIMGNNLRILLGSNIVITYTEEGKIIQAPHLVVNSFAEKSYLPNSNGALITDQKPNQNCSGLLSKSLLCYITKFHNLNCLQPCFKLW